MIRLFTTWVAATLLVTSVPVLAQSAERVPRVYPDTSLTACPDGERQEYFYYFEDTPERRAGSWCGAAQADIDIANLTDPNRWRIPYQVDSCAPGVNWTYSHAFPDGSRYHSPPYRGIALVCSAPVHTEPPLGCAAGAGGFTACPGNPPGPPVADAVSPGTPLHGGPGPDAGPPGDSLPDATAQPPLDEADGGTCTRAEAVGNPIFAGNGNKYQQELDYAGPPGLGLVRHYNSSLPGWVHDHGMRILADAGRAIAIRPDGRALRFQGTGTGEWVGQEVSAARLLRLEAQADGRAWRLITADDTQEDYDAQGQLMSTTERGGRTTTVRYEGGLLRQVSDAFGRSLHFGYDALRRLVQVTTPEGSVIAYAYDGSGRLAQVTLPDGSQRQYLYENGAYPLALTGLVDESGQRFATWAYDAQGRAVASEHAGVQRYQIDYGTDGTVRIVDPLGRQREQRYASAGGRLLQVGQAPACPGCRGDASRRDIDPATGLVFATEDFLGVRTATDWDAQRKLPLTVTEAAGAPQARTRQVQWHPLWRLPLRISEPGRETRLTYDPQGRLLSRTVIDTATQDSRTWSWTYGLQGLPESATDPAGRTWRFSHDAQGNRDSVTDPLGRLTRFTFDAAGRVLTQVDPAGLVTSVAYNLRGWPVSIDRGGERTRLAYTPTGQLASVDLPGGSGLTYGYDTAHRRISVQDRAGNSVAYDLDAAGHRVREQVRDARGNPALLTSRSFNALDQVDSQADASGALQRFDYDANGRPVAWTDPLNQSLRLTLDALGRPTSATFADNTAGTLAWNPLDALQRLTDPKGVSTTYETNAFGEVIRESSPDAGARTYLRNTAGEVVQAQDAKGQVTRFERDALGRPIRIAYADSAQSHLAYDVTGGLARTEDASGTTDYLRDPQGRLLGKTQQVNDQPANPSRFAVRYAWEQGRLASITYPSGLVLRYVREQGRITAIQVQRPGHHAVLQPWISGLAYTALGQPAAWSWANGDSAQRQFDANGRLTQTEFARYGYDAAGRLTSLTQDLWARSVREGREELFVVPMAWQVGYDRRDRLISLSREGAQTHYTYDANSNRLTSQDTLTRDTDLDGQYEDDDYRVDTEQALAIDATSNRLLGFTRTVTQHFPPARNGHPRSPHTVTTPVTYTLDANGSMTSDGLRSFDYDAAGRLSRVRVLQGGDEVAIAYLHNARGQRVFKGEPQATRTPPDEAQLGAGFIAWLRRSFGWLFTQTPANTHIGTAYVYGDGEGTLPPWALLGEYDNGSASGHGRTEYLWLPTEDGSAIPVGLYRGNRLYAIHSDHLGTPRLVTNDRNEPLWQWPYSAFGDNKPSGVLRATANPKAALTNQPQQLRATTPMEMNLRMPGQYYDAEVGTFYNLMRDMDPMVGRYRQSDPIGAAGGPNRFGYAHGDPLGRIDPFGLDDFPVIFNRGAATLWILPPGSVGAQAFAAGNNTTRGSRGPWESGTYRYQYSTTHPDDGPDSAYGSYGNTIFKVPGCVGCGVHSGRESRLDRRHESGVNHVTEGCIRTTDDATKLITDLIRLGHTPVLEVTQ